MTFHSHKQYRNKPHIMIRIARVVIILVVGFALFTLTSVLWFNAALQAPQNSPEPVEIVVEEGEMVEELMKKLDTQGVIKSSFAARLYTRLYHSDDIIQAGTYTFDRTEPAKRVISRLVSGDVSQNYITFVPGSQLGEIKQELIERGYSSQVANDSLKRSTYNNHPLVSEYLPDNADLEGYLYPETYATNKTTDASEVVRSALDQMYDLLTPQLRAAFAKQDLTVHEAVILASLVEKEVSNPDEKPFVAQVFLTRLEIGMALESNATDTYPESYNTYEIVGLPPGPLSNMSLNSLEAVAYPADSDYLFFVTGNDCKTRFSRTLAEHEQLQREHGVGCL